MSSDVSGAVRALAFPTLALLGITALAPGRFDLALRIYAILVAGGVVVVALLALDRAFPRERALRLGGPRSSRALGPPSLERVENEVALGIASSVDLHYRLVPRLRAVATALLASRRGISLSNEPERARRALGDGAWDLVRPDLPAPQDRRTAGVSARELDRALESLERI